MSETADGTSRVRSAIVGAALVVACATAAAAHRPPRPLSVERARTPADTSYGSGGFGTWQTDGFGLPAFRYEVDERSDPRAAQPELAGATDAQHQVGNDHIVAAAFNHGYTQLWSQDRLAQWANRWEPAANHFAGGFGYLVVDGTPAGSTLWLDQPPSGSRLERTFGIGYARKALTVGDIQVVEVTYAPFGDDPLLIDEVLVANTGATPHDVSWLEYWDVNPIDQTTGLHRGVDVPVWNPTTQTLTVAQSGGHVVDAAPLSIFAAALAGPLDGFTTSAGAFFGGGTRAAPAAVVADHLDGTLAAASPPGTTSGTLVAFRAPMTLDPDDVVTVRYAYGMAHPDEIDALVAKYRAQQDPIGTSQRAWAAWLPQADFGRARAWVARELVWDAYLLRSASLYEEACGRHTVTQGGYYQYQSGLNLGTRSWPHYLLPLVYTDPALAREILRYTIGIQPAGNGNGLSYGTGPLCTLVDLGTSGDLDFWVLLAATEYGLGSRDTAFFAEPVAFYDTHAPATVWEHVKLAWAHQETLRGPHGLYLSGTNGDWSDFSSSYLHMTESTLIAAQVAYVCPQLAALADRLGDHDFAREVRKRGAELRHIVRGEWTPRGWYSRGRGPGGQIGSGAIFGEPQPWAILAGLPTRRQARMLVGNVRRFLDGVGAPDAVHGPTRIGSSLTPAFDDPDVTERASGPIGVGDNNANYVGGVWFDVNGWLTWALGTLDGVVPHARRLAWDEYVRNTLATHATAFPDHWAGTISVDDTCYAYYSTRPAQCGNDLYRGYDGQITEQPTWMVMDAIRLAGVTPTERGYRVAPHLPFGRFSLKLPQIGVARSGGMLRGYVRPEASGPIELRVAIPAGATGVETFAGRRVVPHRTSAGFAIFTIRGKAGAAANWAVRW